MRETQTNESIDIAKLEEILKWCRYKPKHFLSNLNDEKNYNLLIQDKLLIRTINSIYNILGITDEDKNNHQFVIGKIQFDDYEKLKSISKKIQLFNIDDEAKLKLTESELETCNEIANTTSFENIDEIKKIDNFLIRSYSGYLTFHNNNSKLNTDIEEQSKQSKQSKVLSMNKKIYWNDFIEYKK